MSPPVHGVVVALWRPDGWSGVLLRGPSGAGKSELALRLMARGWRLVADDYVHLITGQGQVFATAPERIAGKIEVRGIGIPMVCGPKVAPVRLIVELGQGPGERLPEPEVGALAGIDVALIRLDGQSVSAVDKVVAALTLGPCAL